MWDRRRLPADGGAAAKGAPSRVLGEGTVEACGISERAGVIES